MNIFKKLYARIFEGVMHIAIPLLPYRDPVVLDNVSKIPAVLSEHGKRAPLVVTDPVIKDLEITAELLTGLNDAGIAYELYSDVVPNPTTEEVEAARKMYVDHGCDCIIAVGGGSALDCAKAMGARIARPKKQLNKMAGILKVRKSIPLLIAIPTTAGTGSETTLAAVICDSETRRKYAINDFPLIPPYAVLDPKATATLPRHIVSSTGIDALTHALEAYLGRSTTKSTRADALKAIKLIFDNLPAAYTAADEESRKNMLQASHLAGRAFSKSYVGYVHALAHALGGKYNTPHGLANAVLLLPVLRAYGRNIHKKLKRIAVYCGLAEQDSTAQAAAAVVLDKIAQLERELDIPTTLPEIQPADLDELVDHAYREAYPLYPVPVLWDRPQLKQIYLAVTEEQK